MGYKKEKKPEKECENNYVFFWMNTLLAPLFSLYLPIPLLQFLDIFIFHLETDSFSSPKKLDLNSDVRLQRKCWENKKCCKFDLRRCFRSVESLSLDFSWALHLEIDIFYVDLFWFRYDFQTLNRVMWMIHDFFFSFLIKWSEADLNETSSCWQYLRSELGYF